jgi:hypothetical protein
MRGVLKNASFGLPIGTKSPHHDWLGEVGWHRSQFTYVRSQLNEGKSLLKRVVANNMPPQTCDLSSMGVMPSLVHWW